MTAKQVGRRAGSMVLLLLLGAAMFVVPSAYAVGAGKARWLAWTVGVLAFPLAPLVWNILGERGRTVDPKKSPKTTRWERIWLRTGFLGAAVIIGLFALGRGKALRAVRHHALWFIPTTPSALEPDSPLLRRVPGDATTLIWLRDTAVAEGVLGDFAPALKSGDFELVGASGDKNKVFVSERGDIGIVDLVSKIGGMGWLNGMGYKPSDVRSLPDGTRTWATPGWMTSGGPPTALLDQLRRAPSDAFLVGALRDTKGYESAVGWLGGRDGTLEMVGEIVVKDDAAATKMVEEAERELSASDKELQCWRGSGGEASVSRDGRTVRAKATIPMTDIRALFLCLDLAK